MAIAAGHPGVVIFRYDLREALGLGGVLFMTAGAERGGIGPGGLERWIFGVLRQRAMAGFAPDHSVLAGFFHFEDCVVAFGTCRAPCEGDGTLAGLFESITAIVAILAEGLGNEKGS